MRQSSAIIKEVEEYIKEILPAGREEALAHDWKHGFRTRYWALKIARGEGYQKMLLVEIASLLHDIGRAKEKERNLSHAHVSGEMTQEFLRDKDWFSEDEKQEIIYAVANHSKGGEGQLVDIVQDADRLDGLGAMGIMRAFQHKWHLPDYDPLTIVNPFTLSKKEVDEFHEVNPQGELAPYALDDISYALSWYDIMNTKTGKELAEPLVEYTKNFLDQLKREVASSH